MELLYPEETMEDRVSGISLTAVWINTMLTSVHSGSTSYSFDFTEIAVKQERIDENGDLYCAKFMSTELCQDNVLHLDRDSPYPLHFKYNQ